MRFFSLIFYDEKEGRSYDKRYLYSRAADPGGVQGQGQGRSDQGPIFKKNEPVSNRQKNLDLTL